MNPEVRPERKESEQDMHARLEELIRESYEYEDLLDQTNRDIADLERELNGV